MGKWKIGVMSGCFGLGDRGGIEKAAEVGVEGFQIFSTAGEMAPENMSPSGRKEFRNFFESKGLILASLCCDYGLWFSNPETCEKNVENCKRCADLAVDLGTDVMTSHIGTVPDDENDAKWKTGVESLTDLSAYCGSKGVRFACETGPEDPAVLRRFLDQIKAGGGDIAVNYDPANLTMNGFDQLGGVEVLGDYIVHTHAKDGLRGEMTEVPLGEGDVNFPEWLARLEAVGYNGFLVIERETGSDPIGDIVKAIEFLRKF